jgi:hypothetical protein
MRRPAGQRARDVAIELPGGQQVPHVGDALRAIQPHEVSGNDVVEGGRTDRAHVVHDPAALFRRKRYPNIALQEGDVRQCLVANARLVVDAELPALILCVAVGGLPLVHPAAPVKSPLLARLDLDQQWLRIAHVRRRPEPVVDEVVRCVGRCSPARCGEGDDAGLGNHIQHRERELLADQEVALERRFERDRRLAAEGVLARDAAAVAAKCTHG